MEIENITSKDVASFYDGFVPHFLKQKANDRIQALKSFICRTVRKEDVVLDFGCSIGIITSYTHSLGIKCHGVDISDRCIKVAKNLNPEIFFQRYDFREQLLTQKYDVIYLFDVIEHIQVNHRNLLIHKLSKGLKQCGRFMISIPLHDVPQEQKQIIDNFIKISDLDILMRFLGFKRIYSEYDFHYGRFIYTRFIYNREED